MAVDQVSISFVEWRKAERVKFETVLQALARGVGKGAHRWSRVRRWCRGSFALLGFAVFAGVAIGLAVDQFEHEPSQQRRVETASASVIRSALGGVTVVDGDTLKVGNERIRLHGIDAPEFSQR